MSAGTIRSLYGILPVFARRSQIWPSTGRNACASTSPICRFLPSLCEQRLASRPGPALLQRWRPPCPWALHQGPGQSRQAGARFCVPQSGARVVFGSNSRSTDGVAFGPAICRRIRVSGSCVPPRPVFMRPIGLAFFGCPGVSSRCGAGVCVTVRMAGSRLHAHGAPAFSCASSLGLPRVL